MPSKPESEVGLAETLADVARTLLDESDVDSTLERICELAVQTVDGCETAGISIATGSRVTSRVRSDDVPRIVDQIQSETQEGPCVDAIQQHQVFVTGSLTEERRWPNFARRAHDETGVESVLAMRLFTNGDTMGALNLYSSRRDAYNDQDIAVASVFAAHAAVALATAQKAAHLEAKADGRDIIGMAKGIIIARQHVSDQEAFDILRRASQRMNIKLRELADQVVHPAADGDPVEQAL
ncbi:MAG: hypothetical protein V7605_746 [Acidimicrobiaceae bacterium]